MRSLLLLLFLILTPQSVASDSAVAYSDSELRQIEERDGPKVRRRIDHYLKHLQYFKTLDKERQIVEVNTFINGYLPEFDAVIHRAEDHWLTPKEFLKVGYGDCEEYAVAKYYTLKALGFNEQELCLTVVRDLYTGGHHMVLSYFKESKASPLVLDNLSFRVLPLSERKDLRVEYCINSSGVFSIAPDGSRNKLKRRDAKFEDLIKRIEAGR